MSGIAKLFYFRNTPKNTEYFTNWECPSLCGESDPQLNGGCVAHETVTYLTEKKLQTCDGKSHSAHRNCVIKWYKENTHCMSCRVEVDPTPIMTYREWIQFKFRNIPQTLKEQSWQAYEGLKTRMRNAWQKPWVKNTSGVTLICIGLFGGPVPFVPIGTYFCSKGLEPIVDSLQEKAAKKRKVVKDLQKLIESHQSAAESLRNMALNSNELHQFSTKLIQAFEAEGDKSELASLIRQGQTPGREIALLNLGQEDPALWEKINEKASVLSQSAWADLAKAFAASGTRRFAQLITCGFVFHFVKTGNFGRNQ